MPTNKFVSIEDLIEINKTLEQGKDVHIQCTPDGIRILSSTVKVIKRKRLEKPNTSPD